VDTPVIGGHMIGDRTGLTRSAGHIGSPDRATTRPGLSSAELLARALPRAARCRRYGARNGESARQNIHRTVGGGCDGMARRGRVAPLAGPLSRAPATGAAGGVVRAAGHRRCTGTSWEPRLIRSRGSRVTAGVHEPDQIRP
jgi:hypothetical protein